MTNILIYDNKKSVKVQSICEEICGQFKDAGFGVLNTDAFSAYGAASSFASTGDDFSATDEVAVDFCVCLGGDGTFLRASDFLLSHGLDIPIIGVNLGHLGFLAEAENTDIVELIKVLQSGDFSIEERNILQASVNNKPLESYAINEIMLTGSIISPSDSALSNLFYTEIKIDGSVLTTLGSDGIIVSTPTGSTAHAFSAGGPVIWPKADVFELVMIAPYSLFNRPLVLDSSSVVEITVLNPATACFDSRDNFEIAETDTIKIQKSANKIKIIRINDMPYTQRFSNKFSLPKEGINL
jgi:NAD+ kinase